MSQTSRPPHAHADELIGGRYRVLAELGRGGMSVVYRVRDCALDKDVALKLLRLTGDDPRHLLFLQQEFHAMARLRHPRLVQVFDYGVLDTGTSYFTMELLPGVDLSTLRNLPLSSVFQILLSIADALGFMHARGYAHRDVKPSNVRVLSHEPAQPIAVKLMDCGLTERFEREGTAVAGTLAYLAPEAWLGLRTGVRGDLYALGVLAYEITAGGLPFDTSSGVRLLRTKTERPKDLRDVRPDVPPEFARLVRDLLMPEPASRPASAMEVASRISELADIDFQPDPTVYFHTPALVGRSRELNQLRDDIKKACGGTPVPTFIVGPAGAGKTRLLEEILLEAGLRGAVVVRAKGRGFSGGPYEVLRELLAPLLHLPEAETVLSRIGGKRMLMLGHDSSGIARNERAADPAAAQQSLHQAFASFLDGVSKRRRIILAVDDVHLADAASIDALAGLAAAGAYGNIAILATKRAGEPMSQSLTYWQASARVLELDRMTQDQIGELMVAALGAVTPSPALVADLERASAGNVYFVLEILRELAARGLIERKRTRISLPDSLDEVELPNSLSQALERRLTQLSPTALELGRVAAVVGREIDLEFGRTLLGASNDKFFDAIDELRREELVQFENKSLSICHPRLREVLYQGLSLPERRALHQRVADHILANSSDDNRDHSAELGQHFAEAGDEVKALDYLVQAGDSRYDGFAYFDALDAYQRSLELLHRAPYGKRRALERKLNDRLGRICFYHDHRQGPKYLECAREHHLHHGLLWAIAPLSRFMGAALAVTLCVAVTTLLNVLHLRKHPLRLALSHLLDAFASTTYLANCYTYSGRPQLAIEAAEHLVSLIYSRHRLPHVGYLMSRAYALFLMNRLDEAGAASEGALALLKRDQQTPASEHDKIHATGGALITRLWVDMARGYVKRTDWWQPFEEYVLSHPTALLESWLMEARVYAAYRLGNLPDTEAAWKRFSDKATHADVLFVQLKAKVWVGMAYIDAGRTGDAQDLADEVIRVASAQENPLILALGLHLRGMALHSWEQYEDAERCFKESLELTSRADVVCMELHQTVLLSLAVLMLDRKNWEQSRELAQRVLNNCVEAKYPHSLHRGRANRILGRVALAQGDPQVAERYLMEALERVSATDDLLERSRAFHFLAQAQLVLGNESAAAFNRQESEQLLRRMGNRYQLRRLGYIDEQNRSENDEDSPLSVASLVGDATDLVSEHTKPSASSRGGSRPESRRQNPPMLDQQEIDLRGPTLVAYDEDTQAPDESN